MLIISFFLTLADIILHQKRPLLNCTIKAAVCL